MPIKKKFETYLTEEIGISPKSLKFYRSDLSHFTGWILLKARNWGALAEGLDDILPYLSKKLAQEYKNFLVQNKIANKTINRRLSTLRHFGRFLQGIQTIDYNFTEEISNIPSSGEISLPSKDFSQSIAGSFKNHLQSEKVSHNTIKNYLSDIRQFVSWLELPLAGQVL